MLPARLFTLRLKLDAMDCRKSIREWNILNLETNNQIDMRLSHPDLSLSNLIIGNDNNVYIADNELIGVGKGWLLDEKIPFFAQS